MVSNFSQPCGYLLGIENEIYLFPFDETRPVMDDNTLYSLIGDGYVLETQGAEVSSNANVENQSRFKFLNELTINIKPNVSDSFDYSLKRLTGEKWYVVFKDKNGNYWLLNTDFHCRVTYERTFTNNKTEFNNISIKFSLDSNSPIYRIGYFGNIISNFRFPVCQNTEYVKSLYMIERNKAVVDVLGTDDYYFSRIVSRYGMLDWSKVEPNDNTFTLTEVFNGERYEYQMNFSIFMTDYKDDWRDRLIEYVNNRYEVVMETQYRTYAAFKDFFPTYTIETVEDAILINFTFVGVSNIPICYNDSDFDDLADGSENITFVPAEDFKHGLTMFHTKECTGFNTGFARYLLVEEVSFSGERLGRYWCHEDWQDYFSHSGRTIVGTFNDDTVLDGLGSVVFPDSSCSLNITLCNFTQRPQGRYDFNDKYITDTFTVSSTCDWKITNIPDWITLSQTQGQADDEYEIKITAKKQDVYTESYFNLINDNVIIRVIVTYTPISQIKDCNWLESTETDIIEAEETTIRMYLNWQTMKDYNIDAYMIGFEGETEDEVVTWTVLGEDSFMFKFSRYYGDTDHQIILNLDITGFPESACTLVFERKAREEIRTRAEGTICEDGNSYLKYGVYYRYCSGCDAEFSHYEKGELYKQNDPECGTKVYYRWVEVENEGICENGTLYQMEKQEMSYDMVEWTETGVYRKGRALSDTNNICSGSRPAYDEWRETGETVCNGTTLYMTEDHYYSNDGILWVVMPQERRMGRIIEDNSAECGYLPPIEPKYKYVEVKDEYICEEEKQEPIYRFVEDDDNYICEEVEPIYDWERVDGYICDEPCQPYTIEYSSDGMASTAFYVDGVYYGAKENAKNERISFNVKNKLTSLSRFMYLNNYVSELKFICDWDTSNVTDMSHFIVYNYYLTELDLSMFDTSNVENMGNLLADNKMLKSINLNGWNTTKVKNMTSMFASCESLTELDLSMFETQKVTDVATMFSTCTSLEKLYIPKFDMSNVDDKRSMFYNCKNLKYIKCTQAFKDWCEKNKSTIYLDNFNTITWDIV